MFFPTKFWKLHLIQNLKLCCWGPRPCHHRFMSLSNRNMKLGLATDHSMIAYPHGNSRFTRVEYKVHRIQPLVSYHINISQVSHQIFWDMQTSCDLLHLPQRHWAELYSFTILICILSPTKETRENLGRHSNKILITFAQFFINTDFYSERNEAETRRCTDPAIPIHSHLFPCLSWFFCYFQVPYSTFPCSLTSFPLLVFYLFT